MIIHTDLDIDSIRAAGKLARVDFHRLNQRGSKSKARAFDVILTGNAKRASGFGRDDYRPAMWDEWGIFLGAVFRVDPTASCVGAYYDAEHYEWCTNGRFDEDFFAGQALCHHKFEYDGRNVTGVYTVQRCQHCSSIRRYLVKGRESWARITGRDVA